MNALKEDLRKLYLDASKHSVYQNIPDFVSDELGYTESIDEAWRGDRPRIAYLLSVREPKKNEQWIDFGANTGFFTLSLAKKYPQTSFIAIEANSNHAHFVERVAQYFRLENVKVINRAIGLRELGELPQCDLLLHLNVLHHAGHDFDQDLVPSRQEFPAYAQRYLDSLHCCAKEMLFQIGSNWGGDKNEPLVGVRDDTHKLHMISSWLTNTGWCIKAIAFPQKGQNGTIRYQNMSILSNIFMSQTLEALNEKVEEEIKAFNLDVFPGEFYRRSLFLCKMLDRS